MPDPVEPTKPWYLSKSILGAVIVIVVTALGLFGQKEVATAVKAESVNIGELISSAALFVGAALGIFGRIKASTKITK